MRELVSDDQGGVVDILYSDMHGKFKSFINDNADEFKDEGTGQGKHVTTLPLFSALARKGEERDHVRAVEERVRVQRLPPRADAGDRRGAPRT